MNTPDNLRLRGTPNLLDFLFLLFVLLAVAGASLFLTGCSSVPARAPDTEPSVVQFVWHEGERYLVLPVPLEGVQVDDQVAFRSPRASGLVVGRVLQVRAPGVLRVEGPGLQLVSQSNYVGRLFDSATQ